MLGSPPGSSSHVNCPHPGRSRRRIGAMPNPDRGPPSSGGSPCTPRRGAARRMPSRTPAISNRSSNDSPDGGSASSTPTRRSSTSARPRPPGTAGLTSGTSASSASRTTASFPIPASALFAAAFCPRTPPFSYFRIAGAQTALHRCGRRSGAWSPSSEERQPTWSRWVVDRRMLPQPVPIEPTADARHHGVSRR